MTGWTVMNGCGDGTTEVSEVKSICGQTEDFVAINSYRGSVSHVQTREESVGRLNRNCTGTYIGTVGSYKNLFLTAGHCGNRGASASVEFNYEANADGPVRTVRGTFIESSMSPDFALIQLNSDPGVAPTPISTSATSTLTIIQHPAARPKSVAFGRLSGSASGSRIYYAGLDTLGGSSGSGILNSSGQLVGVHTLGGCSYSGGTNSGWTISGIRAASRVL
ncbi:trypsin-like serine peptidase [Oligoflexus tunisiensis]|uniref:trypsin-like serine peptidase n=1 Tax=Oligoflexus tunisiensis TaxID=708132 RepID=UPI001C404680|nr:serine protease [Oligoflexus tunisiensis]